MNELVQATEQIGHRQLENACDLSDRTEFWIDATTFKQADVCPMKAASVGKSLLGVVLGSPGFSYSGSDPPLKLFCLHVAMVIDMLNERLQHCYCQNACCNKTGTFFILMSRPRIVGLYP